MNNVSSDYPGDFTRFTPEKMAEIIRAAYKNEAPPMPETMKHERCKDIVRKDALLDIPYPPEINGNTPSILPMTTPKKKSTKGKQDLEPLDLNERAENGKPAKGGGKKKGGGNRGRPNQKSKRGGRGRRNKGGAKKQEKINLPPPPTALVG